MVTTIHMCLLSILNVASVTEGLYFPFYLVLINLNSPMWLRPVGEHTDCLLNAHSFLWQHHRDFMGGGTELNPKKLLPFIMEFEMTT